MLLFKQCKAFYPARALRALGLLLADGAPTAGGGKTILGVNGFFLRNRRKEKSKDRSKGAKSTVSPRATNGPTQKCCPSGDCIVAGLVTLNAPALPHTMRSKSALEFVLSCN